MTAPWVTSVPLLAGMVATALFVLSNLPMLARALRSKDLRSYSLTNLVMINAGNAFYWLYVANLPPGPIYVLHSVYTVASAAMLLLYLRYRGRQPGGWG
ncbi:hypothetical protein [Deinococcus apachensis]|uniref:hypothetical protein n=1 Tax=Deinococcus apachensis TaxID=309886 RepID=UPI0003814A64|nr:hypothetical protein [Deinococcus apachensis]